MRGFDAGPATPTATGYAVCERAPGLAMRIEIVPDYDAMSRAAATIVAETVASRPGTAISLPTGSTPVGMFNELITRVERGNLSFDKTQLFCLDVYVGVTADDPNSLTVIANPTAQVTDLHSVES